MGSPIRPPAEGGLLKPQKQKIYALNDEHTLNEDQVRKSNRPNHSERAMTSKNSTEFFSIVNELAMENKLERVEASRSIQFSKA